ncbi:MAG: dipeptide/oligopeptide/nickel ABC transporter ATP-binding protein [Caldilineaceae bacterium]
MKSERTPVLQVEHLQKYFPVRRGLLQRVQGYVKAVDDVSFTIYEGETLGLVGESGCGKTTTARAILQLDPPTAGSVRLRGRQLVGLHGDEARRIRTEMQIVFQNPYSSLNPRMTVGRALMEPMLVHGIAKGKEAEDRVSELLRTVGLNPYFANRFPAEFFGRTAAAAGLRLAVDPYFVICDEPISSLDVRSNRRSSTCCAGCNAIRAYLPVRLPRSFHGALHQRPHDGDVSGQDRGTGRQPRTHRRTAASVHQRALVGRAHAGPRTGRSAAHRPRVMSPARSTRRRLQLLHTLPPCHGDLREVRQLQEIGTNRWVACHLLR